MGQSVAYNSISYTALQTTVGDAPDVSPLDWVSLTVNDPSLNVFKDSPTGSAQIPSGTTAQRPVSPISGSTRFNSTLGYMEIWNGTAWANYDSADKLPLAGGTMIGAITALRETKVAMGANNIELASGNVFTKTIAGATTLTVSGWLASGNSNSFILELTNGGSAVVTWFSGVKWAGGTAPTLTAAGVDIIGFYSHDGGTNVRGIVLSKDSK
jgi:hypothetical protein